MDMHHFFVVGVSYKTANIDLRGKFIYPSFIDLYSDFGMEKFESKNESKKPQLEGLNDGPYFWNESTQTLTGVVHFGPNAESHRGLCHGAKFSCDTYHKSNFSLTVFVIYRILVGLILLLVIYFPHQG